SAAEDDFTADLLGRMARISRDPIAIDFIPHPHVRVQSAHGFAEVRDGVERAVIDGIAFDRDGTPPRLVDDGDHVHAEWQFVDGKPWTRLATLSSRGELVAGPFPIPASDSKLLGVEFTPPLRTALARVLERAVPPPLARAASARL